MASFHFHSWSISPRGEYSVHMFGLSNQSESETNCYNGHYREWIQLVVVVVMLWNSSPLLSWISDYWVKVTWMESYQGQASSSRPRWARKSSPEDRCKGSSKLPQPFHDRCAKLRSHESMCDLPGMQFDSQCSKLGQARDPAGITCLIGTGMLKEVPGSAYLQL